MNPTVLPDGRHDADERCDVVKVERIEVAGVSTAYRDRGSGRTAVLMHGGDYGGFGTGADWDPAVPGLVAEGFRVVAPDKLGQGATDNPPDPAGYTMQAVYEHLAAFVMRLGLSNIVLVGHSRGALPALLLTLDRPELVDALVMVDTNTVARDSPLVPQGFYERAYANMAEPPGPADVRREAEMNSYRSDHLTDEYVAQRVAAASNHQAIERRRILATGAPQDVFLADVARLKAAAADRVRAGELRADTLLVWGANDPSAPMELGIDLFREIAHSNQARTALHVLNHAGHYSFREQPESFTQVVAAFARGSSACSLIGGARC